MEIIKQEEEKVREELSKEVEAKEENLAEGKLEIDDPLEIEKTEDEKEISSITDNIQENDSIDDNKKSRGKANINTREESDKNNKNDLDLKDTKFKKL